MSGSLEDLNTITLIILVIAIVILFIRLRSVLGRRTGHERPPLDHTQGRSEEQYNYEQDNVVHLPTSRNEPVKQEDNSPEAIQKKVKEFAPDGSELHTSLTELIKRDPDFDPKTFIEGAKAAYEMIVMAFNEGDRKTLKPLLSSDVYESFDEAIAAREDNEQEMEVSFIGINKAVLLDCELDGSEVSVTVKFVSNIISAMRDSDGELIGGDPKKIIEVTDIWTFSRKVTSRDPNWKLVGTESAN